MSARPSNSLVFGALAFFFAALGYALRKSFGVELVLAAVFWVAVPVLIFGSVVFFLAQWWEPKPFVLPIIGTVEADEHAGRFYGMWMLTVLPFGLGAGLRWEPY